MMQQRPVIAILTANVLVGVGLRSILEKAAPAADVEQPGESWTVLIYSMADTDLEPFMVTDINEAGEVGSTGAGLAPRAGR